MDNLHFVPTTQSSRSELFKTYGLWDGGTETQRWAWTNISHVWSVRNSPMDLSKETADTRLIVKYGPHRVHSKLMRAHPVDILAVDRSGHTTAPAKPVGTPWELTSAEVAPVFRPKIVFEAWYQRSHLWKFGPVGKLSVTRWENLGFSTHCRRLKSTQIGGASAQTRLIVVRISSRCQSHWDWPLADAPEGPWRSMSNLLSPPGFIKAHQYLKEDPSLGVLPNSLEDPMPCSVGTVILTPSGRRRILPEEIARSIGVPKGAEKHFSNSILARSSGIHFWEYLSYGLVSCSAGTLGTTGVSADPSTNSLPTPRDNPTSFVPFGWLPPDLSVKSDFFKERERNLREACQTCPCPEQAYKDGLESLDIHRRNYDATGPNLQQVRILWWEFPPQHWVALREGSKMNFAKEPPSIIHDNAPMDDDQRATAVEFVEELRSLHIIGNIRAGAKILSNAPMFVVPKEGQPGQWRVIADMLRGMQNDCIAPDPTVLPRISLILDQLYTNGYSAVADASKFFWNFPTHPDDHPHLGVLHPETQELLTYFGLPMGSSNSPPLAGRYGLAFIRMIREKCALFQGQTQANCWWTSFEEQRFDPSLGYGCVLISKTGAAVRIFVWVDDFLIHGPTYESTCAALTFFLDTALSCGMLCHPKKLVAPCQSVKYVGFLLDTTDIPNIRIPTAKRERSLAMVEHLTMSPLPTRFSRLSLAVIAGTLQSLVDATPKRYGQTMLQAIHKCVHDGMVLPTKEESGITPYCSTTTLPVRARQDLKWWISFLEKPYGRLLRGNKAATLIPTFGDGSGSGTGGTLQLPGSDLIMWQGVWSGFVKHYSSNWKELATLLKTMQALAQLPSNPDLAGTTLFYFTDNSTTYWIADSGSSPTPRLHDLISQIKTLEATLDVFLQVIHIPGVVMITQGTDGLSRGIWMSPFHHRPLSQQQITSAIFAPISPNLPVVDCLFQRHHIITDWTYMSWSDPWKAEQVFGKCTVWFPPPEIARQLIYFLLESWCEVPLTTSALILVPRTIQAHWSGLSRYLVELETLKSHEFFASSHSLLPIPCVALYLAPHLRVLPEPHRMDRSPHPSSLRWHREQAALVRGLPTRTLVQSEKPDQVHIC